MIRRPTWEILVETGDALFRDKHLNFTTTFPPGSRLPTARARSIFFTAIYPSFIRKSFVCYLKLGRVTSASLSMRYWKLGLMIQCQNGQKGPPKQAKERKKERIKEYWRSGTEFNLLPHTKYGEICRRINCILDDIYVYTCISWGSDLFSRPLSLLSVQILQLRIAFGACDG